MTEKVTFKSGYKRKHKKIQKTQPKKIKIEYVEDSKKRSKCFYKRKRGILKKAGDLSIMTGCNVLVVIKNKNGIMGFGNGVFMDFLENTDGSSLLSTATDKKISKKLSIKCYKCKSCKKKKRKSNNK